MHPHRRSLRASRSTTAPPQRIVPLRGLEPLTRAVTKGWSTIQRGRLSGRVGYHSNSRPLLSLTSSKHIPGGGSRPPYHKRDLSHLTFCCHGGIVPFDFPKSKSPHLFGAGRDVASRPLAAHRSWRTTWGSPRSITPQGGFPMGCLTFLGKVCVTLITTIVMGLVMLSHPMAALIIVALAAYGLHYMLWIRDKKLQHERNQWHKREQELRNQEADLERKEQNIAWREERVLHREREQSTETDGCAD